MSEETTERNIKQVIVVRKDLNMRKGKVAAQVAHASMQFLLTDALDIKGNLLIKELSSNELAWVRGSFAKVVVSVDSEQELLDLVFKGHEMGLTVHSVTDSGRTEFKGVPTLTCAAFGPHPADVLDPLTGGLRLL
jgi:PTH2 family peptidyl-tRNA hydrolase